MSAALRARGEELARVMEAENAALAARDPAAAMALLPAKAAAVTAFEAAARTVEAGNADRALRDLARDLARLGAENRRLLARALAVQGRVIGLIARAMPAGGTQGYGPARGRGRAAPAAIYASA